MGVSRDPFLTPEEAARILAEGRSKTKASQSNYAFNNFATNQFYGIIDNEPFYLNRNDVDNPAFAWPPKQYMDIAGTSHQVQRGYMRSLITDPNVDINAKNRRLFFQFNPTVLVRSVQQTPGAMLPLLQSPEQLAQPVPGTASFGFELMFNREHEVNTGDDPLFTESLDLPNDQKGFVSQVGVLADIMVLDLITGQGISQDLLDTLAKRQSNFITQQMAAEDAALENIRTLNPEAGEEADKTYVPTYQDTDADQNALRTAFEKQIGNSAFLNPTPFRVMFSSLFMVEGIATSVDVKFTKFSQKMIPVQCTVTINMYALYIGFARKNTFLYDNLVQGSIDTQEQQTKDEEVSKKLEAGLKYVDFVSTQFDDDFYGNGTGFKVRVDATRTSTFANQIEKKQIKDVIVRVKMDYVFTLTNTGLVDPTFVSTNNVYLTYNNSVDIPLEKITDPNNDGLRCADLENLLITESKKPSGEKRQYLSYRYVVEIAGKGDTGVMVESPSKLTSQTKRFAHVLNILGAEKYGSLIADNPKKNKD